MGDERKGVGRRLLPRVGMVALGMPQEELEVVEGLGGDGFMSTHGDVPYG